MTLGLSWGGGGKKKYKLYRGGGHCTSGPLYYGGILRGGYIKKVVKNHRGEGGDMYLRRGGCSFVPVGHRSFGYSYKSNCIRTTENDVHWGQVAVTTVITICFPLMPQKQGAVNQQGQWERAVIAQNRGSVVLFWVPTLKETVPPPPPGVGTHCQTTAPTFQACPSLSFFDRPLFLGLTDHRPLKSNFLNAKLYTKGTPVIPWKAINIYVSQNRVEKTHFRSYNPYKVLG